MRNSGGLKKIRGKQEFEEGSTQNLSFFQNRKNRRQETFSERLLVQIWHASELCVKEKNKMEKKRVAFVTVSYKGHASVLLPQWQIDTGSHLFLLCFQNDPKFEEERERVTIITLLCDRVSENAKEFNDARSVRLEGVLRCFLHSFNPTVVVYDFFCLEAREAAYHLGVPSICSIPAMLKPDETTTCSDGILAKEHFYWLWKHRYPVAISPVAFLGPRVSHIQRPFKFDTNCICVCFGTVVPRYPGCQEKLRAFLDDLFKYATLHTECAIHLLNLDVTRRQVPPNVYAHGYLDFIEFIQTHAPATLVFHGGGNLYTETVELGVPRVLVVPFFGDQFEVGRVVGNVYSGDIAHNLTILRPAIQVAPGSGVDAPFADTFVDYFRSGDLVFGHRRNRDELQRNFPSIDLHLNHYAPFETFARPGALPVIADVYNDSFDTSHDTGMVVGLEEFFRRLNRVRATRVIRTDLLHEHALVHYCIDILRLAVTEWGSKIHFVLGPHEPGIATQIELDFIRENWDQFKHHIIFYGADGRRCPAPFFMQHQKQHLPPFIMEGSREKSAASILHKTLQRNLPTLDRFAERHGYTVRHEMDDAEDMFDVHVQTCDLRVHYYYNLEHSIEVQYWPLSYLTNFARDVETGTQSDRAQQRQAQDELEDAMFF